MINMLLGLFDNKFTDLLGNSSFWFSIAVIIGLIIIIITCIKYPKIGGPILLSIFGIVLVGLDIFCILQLNTYYTAEGGIRGKLTGIFNTNEITIVDDLKFEIKDIELKESTDGVYSASILTDKVLSLDTRDSLGVFINGMPCDTTSEVESDYAIANYVYTFYDNNKNAICTDTLILNFAFYDNSTYLSLSTKGGTLPVEECVNYWHHYFNKNGFLIEIAPFGSLNSDVVFTTGDVTNYSVIKYYVDNALYATDVMSVGSTYTLKTLDLEGFVGWCTEDGLLLGEKIVLTQNMNLYAEYTTSYEYMVTYVVDGETLLYPVAEGEELPIPEKPYKPGSLFLGWSLDGSTVLDLSDYVVTADVQFVAVFDDTVGLYSLNNELKYGWDELVSNGYVVVSGTTLEEVDSTLVGRLVIPNSITFIDSNAFRDSKLTEVVLGSNLTKIDMYAFKGCKLLESITIPDKVATLGIYCFEGCSALKDVKFLGTDTKLFAGVFLGCTSLEDIVLPVNANSIPSYTFKGCLSLTNIVIPQTVNEIEYQAFAGCTNLETIYIPDTVNTIGTESVSSSIIMDTNLSIIIYCEATQKQDGWSDYWNYCNLDGQTVTVKYGYTYEQYLAEIY